MSHAQSHLLSPSVNSGNNNGSGHHNQRTKSLPNVLNSFGDHRDLLSSGESKPSLAAHLQGDFNHHHSRQGSNGSNVHPDGDHYYGSSGGGGNNSHGGNNQSYHFTHNANNTHHQPGGNNAQSHNIDYLSTADTSDGEDIPVLEIDLTN